jgi:hypothetical protein
MRRLLALAVIAIMPVTACSSGNSSPLPPAVFVDSTTAHATGNDDCKLGFGSLLTPQTASSFGRLRAKVTLESFRGRSRKPQSGLCRDGSIVSIANSDYKRMRATSGQPAATPYDAIAAYYDRQLVGGNTSGGQPDTGRPVLVKDNERVDSRPDMMIIRALNPTPVGPAGHQLGFWSSCYVPSHYGHGIRFNSNFFEVGQYPDSPATGASMHTLAVYKAPSRVGKTTSSDADTCPSGTLARVDSQQLRLPFLNGFNP